MCDYESVRESVYVCGSLYMCLCVRAKEYL